MMDKIEKFIALIRTIAPYWRTRKGLFHSLLALNILYVAGWITYWSTVVSVTEQFGFRRLVALGLVCFGLAFVNVFATLYWYLSSGRILVRKGKFNIVFCLKRSDPVAERYFHESLDELKHLLRESGLIQKFRFIDIGSDIINCDADAKAYVERHKLDLAFHGMVSSGLVRSASTHEYKMRITWGAPPIPALTRRSTDTTDAHIFANPRDWQIREVDSKSNKENVAGGFYEITLFLVALARCNNPADVFHNIQLLEAAHRRLLGQTKNEKPKVLKRGKQLKMSVALFRRGRVADLLKGLYTSAARLELERGNYPSALKYTSAACQIAGPKWMIWMIEALCFYRMGDLDNAKAASEFIDREQKDHPAALVNLGFLHTKQREFGRAANYYKKLMVLDSIEPVVVTDVAGFLETERTLNPHEPGYIFALGVVYFGFIDTKNGRDDLAEFLKQTENMEEYSAMRDIANTITTMRIDEVRSKFKRELKNVSPRRKRSKRSRRATRR